LPPRRPLPGEDHVSRFVPYNRQHRDAETDEFLGITPGAMELSAEDKGGLSVTWIEHFGAFGRDAKRAAAAAYRESLRSKHIGPKGVFAAAQVNAVLEAGRSFEKQLRVVHDPVLGNPGHSEVRHFTDEDLAILDRLAEVFSDFDIVSGLRLPKRPAP
jgi:hypothetical protein